MDPDPDLRHDLKEDPEKNHSGSTTTGYHVISQHILKSRVVRCGSGDPVSGSEIIIP
jgi:hypothetical protein